ncbi:MAG: hypothetical protein FH753_04610 [Firmicutes bacterium]|nr:hypothetical protein [Bacillota bacterium]
MKVIIILIITLITFITFYKSYKSKKSKNNLLLDLKYKDIEISLLGVPDLDDFKKENNPFNSKYNENEINLPMELIVNGKIKMDNLNTIKKDYYWLRQTINKKGTKNIDDVNYAILDESGILHIKNN